MPEMSTDALRTNLTNPARAYLWEVIIPTPLAGDSRTWLIRARTTSIPERSFGNIHVPYKQTAGVDFPGKIQYPHTLDITFIEGEDRQILKDIYDWMNSIIDDKTGIGEVLVKTNIYLNLINTDGTIALKYKVVGCWPERKADITIDWNSEAEINIPTTWHYDRWEQED